MYIFKKINSQKIDEKSKYTNAHFWNPHQNSEDKNVFEVNYLKKKVINKLNYGKI